MIIQNIDTKNPPPAFGLKQRIYYFSCWTITGQLPPWVFKISRLIRGRLIKEEDDYWVKYYGN